MKQPNDYFKIRRRIAVTSFVTIILSLLTILTGVMSGDEKIAKSLNSASGTITPIILFLTGIIGQYQYSVFKTDTLGGVNDTNTIIK